MASDDAQPYNLDNLYKKYRVKYTQGKGGIGQGGGVGGSDAFDMGINEKVVKVVKVVKVAREQGPRGCKMAREQRKDARSKGTTKGTHDAEGQAVRLWSTWREAGAWHLTIQDAERVVARAQRSEGGR